jgi:2-polyprenyl-6-methoxyphenol hydroxylase-like FAD-dependent oxidoreductase
MSFAPRAAVIGGSMGGLFAAHLLLRAGWDVQVYERVAGELEGRGAGIVTHPELWAALDAAGLEIDYKIGIQVGTRLVLDREGAEICRADLPQIFTAWSRFYQVLRSAFPDARYHAGKTLVDFRQDAGEVSARFSDGETVQADLLLAADGLRSTVRQALLPGDSPRYAGYVAWRGLVEESALSSTTLRDVFPYFAFGLPPGEQFIAYPVAGHGNTVEAGHRRYNFVWYRPADQGRTLRDLLTDANGKHWPEGIPPPLIRPEIRAAARQAAAEVLPRQFAEVVTKTENLFFQPIFDLESSQMAFGRVALLGDAAFVARPHCGMGVTKAAGDAIALVAALTGRPHDVATALAEYANQRLPYGRAVVGHARALGAYMQAQISTPDERAMAEKYRQPEAVMRETAIPFAADAQHEGMSS